MSASLALQAAIKSALEADTALAAAYATTVKVYDDVPDEHAFPYIYYEVNADNEWDTSTEIGWDCRPRIHVFAKGESSKFVREVQAAIYNALHNTPPMLTGFNCVLLRVEGHQCFPEPDGQVWHSLTSFRALVEEN